MTAGVLSQALAAEPGDALGWMALADLLEEGGRAGAAALARRVRGGALRCTEGEWLAEGPPLARAAGEALSRVELTDRRHYVSATPSKSYFAWASAEVDWHDPSCVLPDRIYDRLKAGGDFQQIHTGWLDYGSAAEAAAALSAACLRWAREVAV